MNEQPAIVLHGGMSGGCKLVLVSEMYYLFFDSTDNINLGDALVTLT